MLPIDISFHRSAKDLAVTCDLERWRRLRQRYGYSQQDSQEIQQGITIYANVTVSYRPTGFPPEAAEFPGMTARFDVAPAIVDIRGKKLTIQINDYEQQPLQPFKTGNHGWLFHYELLQDKRLRYELDARISFRLPGPIRKDIRDPTLGILGSQFESNRRRH